MSKLGELIAECERRIGLGHKVMIVLIGRSVSRAGGFNRGVRLFGRHGGPLGEVAAEEDDGVVAWFDPKAVIAAIAKTGGKPWL